MKKTTLSAITAIAGFSLLFFSPNKSFAQGWKKTVTKDALVTEDKNQGTNVKVGINVANPAKQLEVRGTVALHSNVAIDSTLTLDGNYILNGKTGSFKNNAWTSAFTRLMQVDAAGNVSPLAIGLSTQYLSGNNTYIDFPPIPPFLWVQNGTSISYTGNVDVTGDISVSNDLFVSNNVVVGGQVLIGQRIKAITEIATPMLRADTIRMDTLKRIVGTTIFTDPMRLRSALSVIGDASFLGNTNVLGTATFNQININQTLSSPVLVTGRIKSSQVGTDTAVHIGDSSVTFYTYPPVGSNPSYDLMYTNIKRLAIGVGIGPGVTVKAYGLNSIAMGLFNTEASGQNSIAIGKGVKTSATATGAIAFGSGIGSTILMVNNTPNSLAVGFNSDIPTLFVSSGSGAGTTGDVGIGTTNTLSKLTVNSDNKGGLDIVTTNNWGGMVVKTIHTSPFNYNTYIDVNLDNTKALAVINEGTGPGGHFPNENFLVWGDGRTQIGYQSQKSGNHTDALLTVNGKAVARSFYVTQLNWADFVLKKTYKLMPWQELDKHIKEKGQLPDVPSTKQMQEKGNNLGETDALLLQKTEENTLYIIDIYKKFEKLEKENAELKNEITKLKAK